MPDVPAPPEAKRDDREFDEAVRKSMGGDGHRVVLSWDDGCRAKLICPESGCRPAITCGWCGRDVTDPESKPCYDCRGGFKDDECWIKSWFDNCTADELLSGEIEFPVTVTWESDHPLVEIDHRQEARIS